MEKLTNLLLVYSLVVCIAGMPGDKYALTGSWFKDRISEVDVEDTLTEFKSIGGDTVILRGAEFLNRTAESIKSDPLFTSCKVGGKHCVDIAQDELTAAGLQVLAWATYSYEEDYTEQFAACKGFDKTVTIVGGSKYYRLVLWMEQFKTADDCQYINGSKVAVLFTSYSGAGDPHALLLSKAKAMKMAVYMGSPKPPYIGNDDASALLINAFFQFNYKIFEDHKRRFSNNTYMKGYYSDVEVIPDYIINEQNHTRFNHRLPPRFVVMFWRELYFLTGNFGYELIGSPTIDLTHAANTTLAGHINGIKSLIIFANFAHMLLRDGRGEGQAAYFRQDEKHKPIYDTEYGLWEILSAKNKSVTQKTTYADVYYASIADFFTECKQLDLKPWLMIEAYDNVPTKDYCKPVDTHHSGMDKKVRKVEKFQLDKALSHVGAMVSKVTAFAWDPMFTCNESGSYSLAQQIKQDYQRPIISECRFHSPQNQSIVVIGYHIEGPLTQPFQVNYTIYDGTYKSISLNGYYFELDYGRQHGLVDSLVYIQLYDIPDLRDLKRKGSIRVARTDGIGEPCVFNYTWDSRVKV